MSSETSCGCHKPRKVSKGLMTRVANYIRDKSVDGICVKSIADIADEMGLLLPSILVDVIEQLEKKGTIQVRNRGQELTDISTFVFIGDNELTKLLSTAAIMSQDLEASLGDNKEFMEFKSKVNEMINIMEQQTKEVLEFQAFKSGVVKQIEAQDGVYHIISRTKLKLI
ncbi:hypothetical protein [Desulforamulus aquiferis]|uniref:Uncharacterized protein n=1 Tax=Desulforamulus aquiferis TaxID=1397668 RepID=A0AAW7ZB09_9FIRM|nr:hypothetical protein [Desulforamulus aquiferis]MDO7786536.1 hypothetical protein [Desulforamulus aquiferis]